MTAEAPKPTLQNKLANIQQELNAPKSNFNEFGRYEYRSCEDILSALKPILNGAVILLTDEIVQIGERYYLQATATLSEGEESISTKAYAREEETKKGMDAAQITGSASSYARKYALNGLFAIDDTKDSDVTNTHGKAERVTPGKTVTIHAGPEQQQPENGKEPTYAPLVGQITDGQRKAVFGSLKRLGVSEDEFKARFSVEHINGMTKQQASDIISQLNKMKEW